MVEKWESIKQGSLTAEGRKCQKSFLVCQMIEEK